VQDAGELGIGGVTVQLTPPPLVDLGNGPGMPITTVTAPDGTYLFNNLPIGDYQVDVISGLNPAYQQTGDPDASLDNHSDVTLALNPSDPTEVIGNLDQDFGYSEPVSVGGYVWEDLNMDGLQDSDEPAIAGSTVILLVDDGTGNFIPATSFTGAVVADITVGQNGQYLFDNLPEGDYKIQISKPNGTLPSPIQQTADDDDTPNDSNIASEPTPDVFESGVFMLRGGLEPVESNTLSGDDQDDAVSAVARDESGNMTVDFGFVSPASIGNRVWLDFDGDGVQDANEDGIAGITVVLTPPAGIDLGNGPGVPIETITGSDGEYLFPDLPPADGYVVTIPAPPANLTSTFDEDGDNNSDSGPISLLPGEEHLTADFGYAPPAGSIGDTIWIDADGDGVQDPGELGIPGITVNLLDEDGNVLQTLVTDAQGKYLFTGLPEGIYGVEVDVSTLPPGYTAHPN
ncbi:MAG: hypothetical protein KAG66_16060, partial [Methylococcales bacterium]|nr:hypothetical protein [Methylococcales bacterium]